MLEIFYFRNYRNGQIQRVYIIVSSTNTWNIYWRKYEYLFKNLFLNICLKYLFSVGQKGCYEIFHWKWAAPWGWLRQGKTIIGSRTGTIIRLACLEELSGYDYLIMNEFLRKKLVVEQSHNIKRNKNPWSSKQRSYLSQEKRKSWSHPLANSLT